MASNNTNNFQSDGSAQYTAGSGTVPGGAYSASNASGLRLAAAGIVGGSYPAAISQAGKVFNINFQLADGSPIAHEQDWRVRVSMARNIANMFYDDPANFIMHPLNSFDGTSGVVFPYTPSITVSHNARYSPTVLTHSNYSSYFYDGSEVSAINVTADFTVQNVLEGQYLMAVIQFLRACTKMFFGNDQNAGSPLPMVFLDGYGPAYLPHVPCVITNFTHTMPMEVDYVNIPVGVPIRNMAPGTTIAQNIYGSSVRLPTNSTIQLTLQPVYSRKRISQDFDNLSFNRGGLVENGTSNKGGFL